MVSPSNHERGILRDMTRTCRTCNQVFTLTPEEIAGYAKFGFEPQDECFRCSQMQKLSFRNGRSLYRRTCDATKEPIISVYPKDAPFPVYRHDYWFSDDWDASVYGRDIDFNLPFFEQMKELQLKVPRMSLFNVNPENSDFCNMCTGNKDCYCIFGGDYNDAVLYGILCMHNKSSVDCDYGNHNELCWDVFNAFECYHCRSVVDCKNCVESAYLSDCIGCTACILCTNLVKHQYCIRNVQLTREEYERQKQELINGSHENHRRLQREFHEIRAKRIVKFAHVLASEDCTGDFIENSKSCQNCFFCSDSEDVADSIFSADSIDSFRSSFFGHHTELCYNCMSCVDVDRTSFCFATGQCSEVEYCDLVINCKNCFGCIGLQRKQYCILNKQYTKEVYEEHRVKLIEHMKQIEEWGKFFPQTLNCFAYNESTAQEFFPLTKEEALKRGFTWREMEDDRGNVSRIIRASELPDRIFDVPDDVLNWAIECEETGRPFRIIKQELAFYREHNIPLPRLHPNLRFEKRFARYANPPVLYDRNCMKCNKEIQTTYSPDRPEIVYCEQCYLETVY